MKLRLLHPVRTLRSHLELRRALRLYRSQPLDVQALLATHRQVVGGARMDAGDDDGDDQAGKDDTGTGTDDDAGKDDDGKDALGDKGKQALDRMKEQRNAARAQAREFAELGMTPAQIREAIAAAKPAGDGDKLDVDKVKEQARNEARAEADRELLAERVSNKIEARAAKKFADPEDALAILLRTRKVADFVDDGKVDVDEVDDALAELLKKKPHLAAQGAGGFGGSADGGARKDAPAKPANLQDAIAARMSGG